MDLKPAKFWNELLGDQEYLHDYGVIDQNRIRVAKEWLKKGRVLNIGSGQGFLEDMVKNDINDEEYEWFSLDIAINGLKRIVASNNQINPVVGSAQKLPFANKTFDSVVCMEVLEHIDKSDVFDAWAEIRKVLADDGRLIVSVPVYEPVSLINHAVDHRRKHTPETIEDEIMKSGFIINDKKYLYAFERFNAIKSKICEKYNFRRPSVCIYRCQKK